MLVPWTEEKLMSDTLYRHWQTLKLIPRAPRKASAAMIESGLRERGFDVSRRSLERDLQKLSESFPLVVDDRTKPYGWSWMKEGAPFDIPGMDVHTALAFRMADEHVARLLPSATYEYLAPHFDHARTVLDGLQGRTMKKWPSKVSVTPTSQPLRPASFSQALLEMVQEGLLNERRLEVGYRKRGEDQLKDYEVHPLGLVHRDAAAYLVCTLRSYEDVVLLALHRMDGVKLLDSASNAPAGFDLEAWIAKGGMGYVRGNKPLALKVRLEENAAVTLIESPLSDDQVVRKPRQGKVIVEATVPDTGQLRAWLRSWGPLLEVLGPASLRKEMANHVAELMAMYRP
jgi:predicted DNA-binding transcriptional regulator YafY